VNDGQDPMARLIEAAGPRADVPADRAARVRAAVHAQWRAAVSGGGVDTKRTTRRSRHAGLWAAAGLAAAAVLVVVIGRAWRHPAVPPPDPSPAPPIATVLRAVGRVVMPGGAVTSPGATLASGAEIETGADGRVALRLSGDGGSVRLDSGTRVTLLPGPVVVLDAGAVYIDSGRGHAGPGTLEVRTSLGLVRDVGTQFEVRLADGDLLVKVRQGQATLVRSSRSVAAATGTQLHVAADGSVDTQPVALQGPDWEWVMTVAPGFDLEGHTLGQYIDWLAAETGWRVELDAASIGRDAAAIVLHGSVTGLRPDETPAAVLPTCGLGHRLAAGTLFITRTDDARGHP